VAQSVSDSNGPGIIRQPGGGWYKLRNAAGPTTLSYDTGEIHTIPGGRHDSDSSPISAGDQIVDESLDEDMHWSDFASVLGADASSEIRPSRDSIGGDLPSLIEVIILGIETEGGAINSGDGVVLGRIPRMCWVSQKLTAGTLSAEDELVDGDGNLYIVFNMCRLSDSTHYYALKWV